MPDKTLAIYAVDGCGGCSQSLLLNPSIASMLGSVNLLFWATQQGDITDEEIDSYDDRGIDVLMYIGPLHGKASIATAKLLRRKVKKIVAYGACAHLGGLCGLANIFPEARLRTLPGIDGNEFIQPLSAMIDVDYVIPGCPPPQTMVKMMIEDLFLSDDMPEPGMVFASSKAVCSECAREHVHSPLTAIRRFHTDPPDPGICLIDQGYVCLGPVTRGGCAAVCLKANRPCTGCAGPVDGVRDQGGAILRALASLVSFSGKDKEKKEHQTLDSMPDVVGTAYKYSAASSVLKRRVNDAK